MRRHLLIIGAQRCGTTYLATMADAHPEITMARPARPEPKVFLSEELASLGLDWYQKTFFAHATTEVILGDKSTSYLEDADAAVRAASMLGDALIVAQLRDPLARAVSNWQFSTEHGLERRPLAAALRENLEVSPDWDRGLASVSPFAYLERGRYVDYLDAWLEAFPGTVRVQFLEDLACGEPVIQELYEWLGVEAQAVSQQDLSPVNASSEPAPPVDNDLELRIRAYFADSDERLATRLGRRLPWRSSSVNPG
jgi:hypothetical protein